MGCYYTVWGVRIQDGVLVYGMGCSYTGRDGVLVYRLGCRYTAWPVSIQDGVLVYGMGC